MKKFKYAIIGAGPSGLGCAKVLKELNIDFQGFESSKDIAGLWNEKNEKSSIYPNLHLISSRKKTEFKTFPMKKIKEDYPHYSKVFEYLSDFANTFGLKDNFKFNSQVKQLTKLPNNQWKIQLSDGYEANFDGIIIATGTCGTPKHPEIAGTFNGNIKHSHDVKDFSIYKNKKVLVIGAGNSGSDMACELARIATHVGLSMRKGKYFIPKYIFGRPADQSSVGSRLPNKVKQFLHQTILTQIYGRPERFGLPKPDYKIYERHPVINSQIMYQIGHGHIKAYPETQSFKDTEVNFINNTSEHFDAVILATGYQLSYPFLADKYLNWNKYSPQLYLNIFNPNEHNLFMLGMIESLGLGWEGRYQQALLVGKYLKSKALNPEKAKNFEQKMTEHPDKSGGYHYAEPALKGYYVDNKTYMKLLSSNIKFF